MATPTNKGKNIILSRRADVLPNGVDGDASGFVQDDLATAKRPKLKFNYTVSFNFRNDAAAPYLKSNGDVRMSTPMTFAVKQASRPNPTVVYQDVNFYNYRSKVATKVDYGTMNVTMFDDVANHAHDIFETYIKSISPIANVSKNMATRERLESDGALNTGFGQTDGSGANVRGGTGSLGPLLGGQESGIISDITIRHWFFSQMVKRLDGDTVASQDLGSDAGGASAYDTANIQYVEYQYINPKMVNMTLDELDMSQSDASTLMMTFVYDSVYISSPKSAGKEVTYVDPENIQKDYTLNDALSRWRDAERLIRKYKRLDTIPDLSVLQTVGAFFTPTSLLNEFLPKIPDFKPEVDLPPVLDGFIG
jgi:hypothetical protein